MTVSFQHLLRSANGGFIVYDCTDQNSFNIAKEWVKTIERQSSSPLTLFLVANKSDVNNRVLSYDDGNSYALEKEFVYMDVSAKDNKGIADMFQKMISLTTEK